MFCSSLGFRRFDEIAAQFHDRVLQLCELVRFQTGCVGKALLRAVFAQLSTALRQADPHLSFVLGITLPLLIFYGGQDLVNRIALALGYTRYIDINPFIAGVCTMGFIFGAYLSETFRGAFMAIPKGQGEAGVAYGMSGAQVFWRILVPQMIRFAIPGFTNNWLVLTKSTALISVIGLQDMMFKAKNAADATHEPFTFFLAVAALYLMLTSVSLLVLRYLENHYSVGIKAAEL